MTCERVIATGFDCLDGHGGRLHKGSLCLLASATSIGKSALALQIARQAAFRGVSVLYISLEDVSHAVTARLLASQTGIESRAIRSGDLTDDELSVVHEASNAAKDIPLQLWCPGSVSASRIAEKVKESVGSKATALVVIDCASYITVYGTMLDRRAEIGMSVKKMAMEMDVAVLLTSQLDRVSSSDRPRLSQVGSLAQIADSVWLLHRDDRASRDAILDISKDRDGSTGFICLSYEPELTEFREVELMAE